MAKYTFTSDLSVKGIKNLQKQLRHYRDVDLPRKCKRLVQKLLDIGVEVSKARIDESPLGKYVTITTNISADKANCKGILLAKGEVKESEGYEPFYTLLAIEFGAGIYHNPTPNPNADKFGLGVGTFPGQTHAFEDMWFYWDEDTQSWKPTHGVKATMPMYYADLEIKNNIIKAAIEAFDMK